MTSPHIDEDILGKQLNFDVRVNQILNNILNNIEIPIPPAQFVQIMPRINQIFNSIGITNIMFQPLVQPDIAEANEANEANEIIKHL